MNCEQAVRHSKRADRVSAARNAHISTSHGGVPAVGESTSGEERFGVSGQLGGWGMPYGCTAREYCGGLTTLAGRCGVTVALRGWRGAGSHIVWHAQCGCTRVQHAHAGS
jgi:hypothetical protein